LHKKAINYLITSLSAFDDIAMVKNAHLRVPQRLLIVEWLLPNTDID
jgi:hypothetical protein